MKNISVLLVEDHELVREGLRALLSSEPGLVIVGEAGNGTEAIEAARRCGPDLVLMDLAMPLMNGVDATREIKTILPNTRILILSSYGDEDYVQQALKAGASGYLMKQTAASELVQAIHTLCAGQGYFSPGIAKRLRDRSRQEKEQGGRSRNRARLTFRETQVLQLISDGYSNKEIGVQLSISVKTVEKHRQQVMNKLGIHETAGLTRYVLAREIAEHQNAGSAPPVQADKEVPAAEKSSEP